MIFHRVLISWFSGFVVVSSMALVLFRSTSFLHQEGRMSSESQFYVRGHLRCHVDFQAVKKTPRGPMDPTVKQICGSFREKSYHN